MQVHVLITSSGHEPSLPRILQRAAQVLTVHSLWHDATVTSLLPPKATPVQAPGLHQAVRVDAGSLGMAASGEYIFTSLILTCAGIMPPLASLPCNSASMYAHCGKHLLLVPGVLLLHATELKTRQQEQLADALGRPSLAMCPDTTLAVPVTATLWMLAATCRDTLSQVWLHGFSLWHSLLPHARTYALL